MHDNPGLTHDTMNTQHNSHLIHTYLWWSLPMRWQKCDPGPFIP